MPRGFKKDIADTKAAYATKRFTDPKKLSFLSLPKTLPCGEVHELLNGPDKSRRRHEVYERDKGICFWCKVWTAEDEGDACHVRNKAGERCDCLENQRWSHGFNSPMGKPNCHFIHDHPERL